MCLGLAWRTRTTSPSAFHNHPASRNATDRVSLDGAVRLTHAWLRAGRPAPIQHTPGRCMPPQTRRWCACWDSKKNLELLCFSSSMLNHAFTFPPTRFATAHSHGLRLAGGRRLEALAGCFAASDAHPPEAGSPSRPRWFWHPPRVEPGWHDVLRCGTRASGDRGSAVGEPAALL